jgi:hypothetical protein
VDDAEACRVLKRTPASLGDWSVSRHLRKVLKMKNLFLCPLGDRRLSKSWKVNRRRLY